jgi:BRCA1-associated protein
MPDYFFHVGVELFTDNHHDSRDHDRTDLTIAEQTPPNLSAFFRALKPFSRSTERRKSRNYLYDHKQDHGIEPAHSDVLQPDLKDHRLDTIVVEGTDMSPEAGEDVSAKENIIERGLGSAISGRHMKGRYEPLKGQNEAEGFGIVHLYRDSEETAGLYQDSAYRSSDLWSDGRRSLSTRTPLPAPKDEDCTTLCILAVPSYMTPSDFLSWVGEDTRSKVSHFRMVRTSRANRYMVLMKFKNGKTARQWQHEWNNKVFNTMEVSNIKVRLW